MEDRVRPLLLLAVFAACTPRATVEPMHCPAGMIATTDGCATLPDWNPWTQDAGTDAGSPAPKDAAVEPDAGSEVADSGADDAGPSSFDPRGAWALRVVNVQTVSSQLIEAQVITFVGLSIVRIDRSLGVSSIACSLVCDPISGATTTWPEAAIAATTFLRESASAADFEIGKPFALDRTQILGWMTEDPEEMVPTDRDDWRVYDADNDGNPGVTLEVSGTVNGQVYVVSRAVLHLEGAIGAIDRIDGSSLTQQEQQVLGATNELLVLGETTATPIPEMSRFTMIRVAETIDCAVLVQSADVLFMDP